MSVRKLCLVLLGIVVPMLLATTVPASDAQAVSSHEHGLPLANTNLAAPQAASASATYLPAVMHTKTAPALPPTILDTYVFQDIPPDYSIIRYQPRQFVRGMDVDATSKVASIDEPGSYAGWDMLSTPNEGSNRAIDRAQWIRITLNRAAKLAIVWRGDGTPPQWLKSWAPGSSVVIGGKSRATFTRSYGAGAITLGGMYDPGAANRYAQDTYLVLFAESNGQPSANPAVPSGREPPQPNQPCPGWVHDQYVASGPDGKLYPTWHPQIDPVYWCYFGHEHGSDPALFSPGYKPLYGYVAGLAGSSEPHFGYKSYVVDDGAGRMWLISHHFGTGGLRRACTRYHSLSVAVAEKAQGTLLADLQLMGDFGKSMSNAVEVALRPTACADQDLQPNAEHSTGVRRIPVASQGTNVYEPWRLDANGNILGFAGADWTTNTFQPAVICNDVVCDQPVVNGELRGEYRFITFYPGFGIRAQNTSAVFYTSVDGRALVTAGQPGSVYQFLKPGVSLAMPTFGSHCHPSEPWRMLYNCSGRVVDDDLNLEGALQTSN